MRTDKLTALILAAGYSSRMGEFKPLLSLDGEYVIARAIRNFRDAGITDIRVVVGHRADELRPVLSALKVTIVENRDFAAGMFSSVVAGVRTFADTADGFFLLPGDMPLVKSITIRRLVKTYREAAHSVIYPCFRGRRGHPPLVAKTCFGEILTRETDSNMRVVLEKFRDEAIDLACADQGVLLDMDRPEDYRRATALARRGRIPTPEECRALFELYKVPDKVRRHGRRVAQTASVLAQALNERGLDLNLDLVWAGGVLHDIAKGRPRHAQKGAEILRAEGFSPVADVVREHTDLAPERDLSPDETTLVYLADKFVRGETLMPYPARFRGALRKYGHVPDAAANINKRWRNARIIEDNVKGYLGREDVFGFLMEATAQRGFEDV